MSEIKILRWGDFNRDGLLDRIVARCKTVDGNEPCADHQVEMGLAPRQPGEEPRYQPVFRRNARRSVTPGDSVVWSPDHFYQNQAGVPGIPLPYPVRLARPVPPVLTSEQLIQECPAFMKRECVQESLAACTGEKEECDKQAEEECEAKLKEPASVQRQIACANEAVEDPANHILRWGGEYYEEDPALLYFDSPRGVAATGPVLTADLLPAAAVVANIYAPAEFDFQLNENLFLAVRTRKSGRLAEYLYAAGRGVVTPEFVMESLLADWKGMGPQLLASNEARQFLLDRCKEKRWRDRVGVVLLASLWQGGSVTGSEAAAFLELPETEAIARLRKAAPSNPRITDAGLGLLYELNPAATLTLLGRHLRDSRDNRPLHSKVLLLFAQRAPEEVAVGDVIREIKERRLQVESERLLPRLPIEAKEDRLKRNLQAAVVLLKTLESREFFSPEEIVELLDVVQEAQEPRRGYPAIDQEGVQILAKLLDRQLGKPENLTPLVRYIIRESTSPDWSHGTWERRIEAIQRPIAKLLIDTSDPDQLPPGAELAVLADRIPWLTPAAILAAAVKGEAAPELVARIDAFAHSLIPWHRLAMAEAAPRLQGIEAIPLLGALADDPIDEVKIKAVQGLASLGSEAVPALLRLANHRQEPVRVSAWEGLLAIAPDDPTVREQARNVLRNPSPLAMRSPDESPHVNVLIARFLAEKNDPELASRLFPRLANYMAGGPEQRESIAMMETPVQFSDGGRPTLTLKTLALYALSREGPTDEAASTLQRVIEKETDETNLLLAATGLVRIRGGEALPTLFEKLKRGAPDPLWLYAIEVFRKKRAAQALPTVFEFILHASPRVRRAALAAVREMNPRLVRDSLLDESRDQRPLVRLRVAEALGDFSDVPVAARLVEMTKDPEPQVQEEACRSLLQLRSSAVNSFLERTKRRDPELAARLQSLVVQK